MKGIRERSNGYQVRLMHKGNVYTRDFSPKGPAALEAAEIHLAEKKKERRLNKWYGAEPEVPSKPFSEAANVFYSHWKKERNPDGTAAHTEAAIKTMGYFVSYLVDYFGQKPYESIRPLDIMDWREHRFKSVAPTSVDREQRVLSSLFNTIAQFIKLERIPAFKQPIDPETKQIWNPAQGVDMSKMTKRERIPTDYELRKLHLACTNLNDEDGWIICKLALKSILSEKDLRKLELGSIIDLDRAKTGVHINIPITVLQKLNWRNWRKRWDAIRTEAGLKDIQFRDLRKKGGNHLIGKFDIKLVSQYHGHASVKTTERSYTLLEVEKMRPLANELDTWVEGL